MTAAARPPTYAILPVKRFAVAKTRLGEPVSAATRRALAEAMVGDVLMALRRAAAVDGVLVVTADPAADAIARSYGATIVVDDAEAGQSAATQLGIARARELGAARVVLVPGDCPALDPGELDALLERRSLAHGVTLVPDRHGRGTNALVLAPPDVLAPSFGAGSRARHEQAAAAGAIPCRVEHVPTLAIDVDTLDDLDALRRVLAERAGGAVGTRGMLRRIAGGDVPASVAP